jgi:glucose-6-phosphate 1-dehydrogenase
MEKQSISESQGSSPIAFIIFGVTGDLTRRTLVPALYQVVKENLFKDPIHLIGFARRSWGTEKMKANLAEGLEEFARNKPVDQQVAQELLDQAHYIESDFEDEQGFFEIKKLIYEKQYKKVIFYLATPPNAYELIIKNLSVCSQYTSEVEWMRIVVEKPFGVDLQSAKRLEDTLHQCFHEEQIYRIDHYLGKETVQNILVLRFANGIFEPLWNKQYVDHVQITAAETVGVGSRAGYFDESGVIRDMFANHMLQLLTLTAMEAPYAFNAFSVRDEKMKVLRSLRPMVGADAILNTIRAQYDTAMIGETKVNAYLQEERVAPNSTTETYLAAKVFVDNWRWANVPFYLRSGKRLPKRMTEIAIHFKQVPLSLFNWKNMAGDAPNVLTLRLQPDEGINLSISAKQPGPMNEISPVSMDFCYEEAFGSSPPEAYERLLLDCLQGDQTLFTRNDEVLEQWRYVTDIIDAWKELPAVSLPQYASGSWGPEEANAFIARDGRTWRRP